MSFVEGYNTEKVPLYRDTCIIEMWLVEGYNN